MKSKKVKIRVWICAGNLRLTEDEADDIRVYQYGGWEKVTSRVREATLHRPKRKATLARGEGEK